MKNKVLDYVDFEKVNSLLEGFNHSTGFITAILDLDGNVLSKSGWRNICTQFHRINPETAKKCTISDTVLANKMGEGEKYHFYKCLNGLVDVAVPIIIKGEHIANLFSGQFFFEEPDIPFFIKQAGEYGFEEQAYIEYLGEVPVVTKEKVKTTMDFLQNMTQLICETTLQRLEQIELNKTRIESENLYKTLVKHLPQKIFIKDKESNYLTCNENYANDLGILPIDIIGKNDFDFYPHDLANSYRADDKKIIEQGEVKFFDEKYLHKGEKRWIQTLKVPYRDAENNIIGILGIFHDITERKLAEKDLEESKFFFEQLFLQSYTSTQLLDSEGWCVKINPKLSELFGVKPEDIEGKKYNILQDNEIIRTGVINHLNQVFKNKETVKWEVNFDIRHASESTGVKVSKPEKKWFRNLAYPIINAEGKLIYVIVQHEDITERKQSEDALKLSEEKYRKIFENVQDVFYQIDFKGIITEISPSVFRLAGYKPEDLIGKPVASLYYDSSERDIFLNKLEIQKEVWDYEVRLLLKSGQVKYASLNAHIMLDPDATPIGIEGSIRDISDRKKYEDDLIISKEKAEESDRLKTAFLHNISHEIRTPMNAIIGFTALLGEPDNSEETQSSYIETIQSSSNQLLSIINDIVDIAAIQSRVTKLNISEVNINSALKSLHSQYSLIEYEKKVSLEYELSLNDDEAIIRTDRTKLVQILSNLINNSIKFNNQGGSVDFGYKLRDNFIEFFVSDTGIGIPSEYHLKVFDTFFQVDNKMTRQFEGTGLGLSICKAYVQLLGGEIWLKSEQGEGTTFFFTLPFESVKTISSTDIVQSMPEKQIISGQHTILVAEDDANNFKLIQNWLADLNVKIIYAADGKEAVEKCKQEKSIDLVFMDIKMPVMDGYTATKQIRDFLPDIPIIAQTAYVTDKDKAIESSCTDYICKPYDKKDVILKIKTYLGKI